MCNVKTTNERGAERQLLLQEREDNCDWTTFALIVYLNIVREKLTNNCMHMSVNICQHTCEGNDYVDVQLF